MIGLCAGSVSGIVVYACRKRRPRAASALNAGVCTPTASGPTASARVVSSVTSRIDGRTAVVAPARAPPALPAVVPPPVVPPAVVPPFESGCRERPHAPIIRAATIANATGPRATVQRTVDRQPRASVLLARPRVLLLGFLRTPKPILSLTGNGASKLDKGISWLIRRASLQVDRGRSSGAPE